MVNRCDDRRTTTTGVTGSGSVEEEWTGETEVEWTGQVEEEWTGQAKEEWTGIPSDYAHWEDSGQTLALNSDRTMVLQLARIHQKDRTDLNRSLKASGCPKHFTINKEIT
eukprot:g45678.t1